MAKTLSTPPRRVAIVHEWLVTYAGSERVVRELLTLFPEADLFALVDFLPDDDRKKLFGKRAKTSFIQSLPFARSKYRSYLPLMPLAVEQFDLSAYDLIISSSHAVAKGVLTGPDQTHICYCHTPARYAWEMQHQYLRESGLIRGVKSILARALLHYIRLWDYRTAAGVDVFVANSNYVARRIQKTYGRNAMVVHPPVDVDAFSLRETKENFYLAASRMVPYKRMDLIVKAFAAMPERRLVVVGEGPELARIQKYGAENISFLGHQPEPALRDYLQRARAFVFAAEEDFGILAVEALACGTPLIAFGRGGVLDSATVPPPLPPVSVLFHEQTVDSLIQAVEQFEAAPVWNAQACRNAAARFHPRNFAAGITAIIAANPPYNRHVSHD